MCGMDRQCAQYHSVTNGNHNIESGHMSLTLVRTAVLLQVGTLALELEYLPLLLFV